MTPQEAWDKYNSLLSQHLTDVQYGDLTTDKDDKAVPALWAQRAAFMFTWELCSQSMHMELNTAITLLKESVDILGNLNKAIELLDVVNGSIGEPSDTN